MSFAGAQSAPSSLMQAPCPCSKSSSKTAAMPGVQLRETGKTGNSRQQSIREASTGHGATGVEADSRSDLKFACGRSSPSRQRKLQALLGFSASRGHSGSLHSLIVGFGEGAVKPKPKVPASGLGVTCLRSRGCNSWPTTCKIQQHPMARARLAQAASKLQAQAILPSHVA